MFDWIPQIASALLGVLLLGVHSPSHAADGMSAFCPKPGTVISTSIGGELTIKPSSGMFCSLGNRGGKDFSLYGLLIVTDSPTQEEKDGIDGLWPLKVGNSTKYIERNGRNSWSEHWTVDRKETITTQSGTYDTFVVIDHEETMGTGNGFRGDYIFYVSPDLGYTAKFVFKIESGSPTGAPLSWEVTKVTTP